MQSRVKMLGHPLHQILIVFPLGLLTTSLVLDVIGGLTHHGIFNTVAFYLISAGVVGGILAAPVGLIDWMSIPRGTRARRIGAIHGLVNVFAIVAFMDSWVVRRGHADIPGRGAIIISLVAVLMAGFAGWLGGELVTRLGVGVDDGAHLDAPNSLSGKSASLESLSTK